MTMPRKSPFAKSRDLDRRLTVKPAKPLTLRDLKRAAAAVGAVVDHEERFGEDGQMHQSVEFLPPRGKVWSDGFHLLVVEWVDKRAGRAGGGAGKVVGTGEMAGGKVGMASGKAVGVAAGSASRDAGPFRLMNPLKDRKIREGIEKIGQPMMDCPAVADGQVCSVCHRAEDGKDGKEGGQAEDGKEGGEAG
jgi:hypothetical protein